MIKNIKIFLLVAIILALFLFGCAQQQGTQGTGTEKSPAPAAETTEKPAPKEEPVVFSPLKFTYVNKNYGPQGQESTRYVIYYLEKEQKCSSKDAVAGILQSYDEKDSPERSYWAKVTLYKDDGELGSSEGIGKSELAFDDAKSSKNEFDNITQLNLIFHAAGKNFNSSEAWTSEMPVLLKNVYYNGAVIGNVLGDFSITKKGLSDKYLEKCTEFAVNIKSSTGFGGQLLMCVADKNNSLGLPYVVSLSSPDMNNGPNYELESIEKKSSGITFYPQCMEPFYCKMPALMSEQEKSACGTAGKAVNEIRDDKGCITGDECITMLEFAKKKLMESQNPSCPEPSNEIAQEALKCIQSSSQPKEIKNNEMGCITTLKC